MPFNFGGDPMSTAGGRRVPKTSSVGVATQADLYKFLPWDDQIALRGQPITATPVSQVPGSKDLGLRTTAVPLTAPQTQTPPPILAGGQGAGAGGGGTTTGGGTGTTDTSLDLGGLTSDELNAMLDYISAQTGLTVEQLSQQAGALGDAARQLMSNIQQQYVEGIRSSEANAAQRGLGRSGIFARNVGKVGEAKAKQETQVRSEAAAKLSDLQAALSSLVSQNQLKAAQAGSDIVTSNLSAGEQAALQNRLSDLGLGDLTNIDLSKIVDQAAGGTLT